MRSLWLCVLVFAAMFVACSDATQSSSDSSLSDSLENSSSSAVGCKTEKEDNCEYGELMDNRDGQTYKTVKIADQIWMAENLNFEVDSSFCYKDSAEYCEKYGRLYTWAAAVGKPENECGFDKICSLPSGNVQGVCPEGWHLPSKTEWEALFATADGQSTFLKSKPGWYGSDSFGFSALQAGLRNHVGEYSYGGEEAYFWSSTEHCNFGAYKADLFYEILSELDYRDKSYAYSVRCIKD